MQTGLHNGLCELSELRELVAAFQGTLAEVKTENQLLRQKLELFLKRYFGRTKLRVKTNSNYQRHLHVGRWT